MKKIIKALTIAVLAVAAVFACVFAAGCTDKEAKYNFTIVYADGTAVNGQTDGANGGKVSLQICTNNETNCIPLDLQGIFADANGKLSLTQQQVNDVFTTAGLTITEDVTDFDFDVMNVPGCIEKVICKVNGFGDYTVTLEAA